MLLVILIDVAAIGGLLALAYYPGLERALPFAAFLLVLVPIESALPMGVFSLTTHRIIVTILTVCYCTTVQGPQKYQGGATRH
jgi:hypothetical protein